MLKSLRYRGNKLFRVLAKALAEERQSAPGLPLAKRLKAWRLGFKGKSYVLLGLDENDPKDYLPDSLYHLTTGLDGKLGRVLKDKLLFNVIVQRYVDVPEILAVIGKGRIFAISANFEVRNVSGLLDYCEGGHGVILKPCQRNKGIGINALDVCGAAIYLNGRQATKRDVDNLIRQLDDYLIMARVRQADYAYRIFPGATNTLRILTMQDPEDNHRPFIPVAKQRFGVHESAPTDNWSRGGLSAKVDLDTGRLFPARRKPAISDAVFESHPDTGAEIVGVEVPHWDLIKGRLLEMAESLRFLKFVGWDVVVTRDGFCVIEGNNPPDSVTQRDHPFLADPRIRRFLEYHQIV